MLCNAYDDMSNFSARSKHRGVTSNGYGIRIDWASVGHPRSNGQVERANGMVLQGLKSRIFDRLNKYAGRWVAEVLVIL